MGRKKVKQTIPLNENAEKCLQDLHSKPIFRLSLGSKELFHSNFLEYLWDCKRNDDGSFDRECFISMIRMLFNDENILNGPVDKYILSREKENFDVCIFHKTGTRDVYDPDSSTKRNSRHSPS